MGKVGPKKVAFQDAKVSPGRAQKALKSGPHSKQQNASGTAHSTPNPHGPTDGGGKGALKE